MEDCNSVGRRLAPNGALKGEKRSESPYCVGVVKNKKIKK